MVYVRSRKFCCCIPVRFGVFIISLLGLLGGGAIAVVLWLALKDVDKQGGISSQARLALILEAILWTVLAIVSLFGLIGVIIKKKRFITVYATLLFTTLGINIAAGIFYFHSLFQTETSTNAVNQCINGSTSVIKKDACKAEWDVKRILLIAGHVVLWLILLWGCFIVSDYVGQLNEEEDANQRNRDPSTPGVGRLPIQAPNTTYGGYGGDPYYNKSDYAFSQGGNSFGRAQV